MPRPTSKSLLLTAIRDEHQALEQYLDSLAPDQKIQTGIIGEWSVKDVLAHLLAWEQMCLSWYRVGKNGQIPKTPAEGFTWRQIPELNHQIYQRYQDQPFDDLICQFHASYIEMLGAVEQMSEEELFTPKYYSWTNTTTLGSYVTSATCSHYNWAKSGIRKGIKATKKG